jgi:hypothetical protein
MAMKLSFGRFLLEAGRTLAVPAGVGARIRVHDGVVWATTSGELDDVWLGSGQEHEVERSGLTVIESATRSTFELLPPAANDVWRPSAPLAWVRVPAWLDDAGTLAFLAAAAGLVALVAVAFR